jgi:hypothetical protein
LAVAPTGPSLDDRGLRAAALALLVACAGCLIPAVAILRRRPA